MPPRKTVAECINIYEGKNIKAIQKKALLSFYERHHEQTKRDITRSQSTTTQPCIQMNMMRQSSVEPPSSKRLLPQTLETNINPKNQLVTCDSPNSILQGPIIMGPSISLDEWVPERPPKNRQLLMPMSPDPSLKPQRLSRPSLPLLSPSLNSADSDILSKYDDPFVPSPEQDKEFRQFSQRMVTDNFNQSGEPQMISESNRPSGQIKKLPDLPLHKSSAPRKFINPYIKSTNMKYDMHHKLDQMHSKHMNSNHMSMQDILLNNLTNSKEATGQYRAELINRNHILSERDLKKSQKVLENIKYVQNKCDQLQQHPESYARPYEMSGGPYRAEPVNLQTERHLPYPQLDSNRSFNDKCLQNNSFNSGPPPVGPKIFRSKSETHHIANSREVAQSPSICFSKSTPQNQSMRRKCSVESPNVPANQKLFG